MNLFSAAQLVQNYALLGKEKAQKPAGKLFVMAVVGGLVIAFGAAAAGTAAHGVDNASLARLISGLVFPFGLGIVMLLGAELFTGNTMICLSVLDKKATVRGMLRNWLIVYLGNFAGGALLAAGNAFFGQLRYADGALAAYTIRLAAAKCAMPFQNVFVLGIFCNILVCAGVLCSLSAKDTAGRILGAYIPVALFVMCGYEHCVANMYYVPAGLFALQVPSYAALAAAGGVDTAALTWGGFLLRSLLPSTLGNIVGGAGLGAAMWLAHLRALAPLPKRSGKKT